MDSAAYGLVGAVLQAIALRLLAAFLPGHIGKLVKRAADERRGMGRRVSLFETRVVNAATLS